MEKIGLSVTDTFKINISDFREIVLEGLKNSNIEHTVAFDKVNDKGIKETIITLRNPDTEITLENDVVQHIKTVNTKFAQLDSIKDIEEDTVSHIHNIKKRIEEKFELSSDEVTMESIDSSTMSVTVIIKYDNDSQQARVHVIRDTFGNVFMNTITHM